MRPLNHRRDQWITALTADQELSADALDVGHQLADAVLGLSAASFTTARGIWQRLPHLTPQRVLAVLAVLKAAGYVKAGPYGARVLTVPRAA